MHLTKQIGLCVLGLALGIGANAAEADIVVVVSPSSPLLKMSKHQLADIYLGKASYFPDGKKAEPIDQPEGAAARDEFYAKFIGKSPVQVKAYWSKTIFTGRGEPPREVESGIEVKNRVTENPYAIGYIEQNEVDDSVRVLLPQ
ncbi:MAG TPA: phosphate ABC transporter substrate-binding protein [Gallionella sp.]|nr:phosphate ABC transporter substrate-binding protein [Gallionella sp.]